MRRTRTIPPVLLALIVSTGSTFPALSGIGDARNIETIGRWFSGGRGSSLAVTVEGATLYFNEGRTLKILDVTNPTSPEMLGLLELPSEIQDIACEEGIAYVADLSAGLRIIDVSSPAAPVEIGSIDSLFAHDVAIVGGMAYVASGYGGLRIIDVSDPTTPEEVGKLSTGGVAHGVDVSGGLAFVTDKWEGLIVVDVSEPSAPVEIGSIATPGQSWDVVVADDLAYVADSNGGLRIFDISDPTAPTEVASIVGDVYPLTLALSGDLAYLANGSQGVTVVDVSDPTNPTRIGWLPQGAFDVAVSDDLAYLTFEMGGLAVVDVTDPTSPVLAGTFDTPGAALGVDVHDGLAYLADNDGRLRIVDVSMPSTPLEVGSGGTCTKAQDVVVSENLAFVADWDSGLHIIDVTDPTTPVEIGTPFKNWDNADGLAVCDRVVYVAASSGLFIVDATDASAPKHSGFFETAGSVTDVIVTCSTGLAYVTAGEGFLIIDVSNPATPAQVGFLDTPGSSKGVAVSGALAYVADGESGLRIIDISDPTAPTEIGSLRNAQSVTGVDLMGSLAFVTTDVAAVNLLIVDVSDPAAPDVTASLYLAGHAAKDVTVKAGLVYLAAQLTGLTIIDVSTPTVPPTLARFFTVGFTDDVAASGDLALVADWDGGIRIFDITNPGEPTEVGTWTFDLSVFSVALSEDLPVAYALSYYRGVHVLDISDPVAPNQLALIDVGQYVQDMVVSGDLIYLTATSGLFIFDVSDPTHPRQVAYHENWAASSLVVSANLACQVNDGLQIIDVSDPATPTVIDVVEIPNLRDVHAISDGLVFVSDLWGLIHVVDISNPAAPIEIGDFYFGWSRVLDFAVIGNLAWVAGVGPTPGAGGIRVFNITDPEAVFEEGYFQTHEPGGIFSYNIGPQTIALSGSLAYVANHPDGMWILSLPDGDQDEVPTYRDNCPGDSNFDQLDYDTDGTGDACELGADLADVNHSGGVDGFDLILLGLAFGATCSDSHYNAAVDFYRDDDLCQIEGEDLSVLASVFARTSSFVH